MSTQSIDPPTVNRPPRVSTSQAMKSSPMGRADMWAVSRQVIEEM